MAYSSYTVEIEFTDINRNVWRKWYSFL